MKVLFSTNLVFALVGIVMLVLTGCGDSTGEEARQIYFLTGSYSSATEPGVKLLAINPDANSITSISESSAGTNPSFLAWSEKENLVYAINEISEKDSIEGGAVSVLSLNQETGNLQYIKDTRISGGGPCHVSISADTESLFISNYGDGTLSAVKLDKDGLPLAEYLSISFGKGSQVSHVHMALPIPGENKLLISDLGLDRLVEYNLEDRGENYILVESDIINLLPGSGPRHFVLDSVNNMLYVACELSSQVEVFNRCQDGYRSVSKVSSLPEGYKGENYCSHIEMSRDRKYLYVGNRGQNTIAVFDLNKACKPVLKSTIDCRGDWPRHFAISPDGNYMIIANQRSNNITFFEIDREDGLPFYTGLSYDIESPSCVLFLDYKSENE